MIMECNPIPIVAKNEEHKNEIRSELKKEYDFYIRVQRILMKNRRHWRLINDVNNIIQDLSYSYNHIFIPPSIR